MALAILRLSRVPGSPGTVAFTADLGSNRCYQVVVGDDAVDKSRGFPVLEAPIYTSPIAGPLPESAMGRTSIEVPVARFDRDHRTVQLWSFRTRERDAPAVSDIVRVPVASRASAPDDLPPIAFSMRHDMQPYSHQSQYTATAPWTGASALAFREARPISQAMFLGSLLPILKDIVPKVLPMIGNLFGGGGGGGKANGTAPPVLQNLMKPETIQLITKFLEQLQAPVTTPPGGTPPTPTPQQSSLAFSADGYSHAAIAPALLAALPALAPLLEKVLTPETIKAVLDHADPTKVIGAVTDSVKEIGKLGLDFDKQSNEHLRALNPMGVHGAVDDLLKGMGFAASASKGVTVEKGEPAYRRVESVELGFAGASPVMIHGRSRVCYRLGSEVAFALTVKTPRPIAEARLSLLLKDPSTRKILVRKSFPIAQAVNGPIATRIALAKEDTERLKAGEEYLVCAYLLWKNGKGKVIGTSRTQMITLIEEYLFDRIEEGPVVPLNDVAKYRAFWHKVWQGSFTKELFKVDFDGKYYYTLDPERQANTPIATSTTFDKDDERVKHGRLKSGMSTTLGVLNALVPHISDATPLNEAQLTALRSSDFVGRVNSAARFSAVLSGKPGTNGAIWVYPEVKLHEVVLYKAASADADSHVRELTEQRVRFPLPVTIHVIGARSTR
jgi:hypothetical protein